MALCRFHSPVFIFIDPLISLSLLRKSANMSSINTANINFKWDPKSLEIRTLAVERLLEPLVTQVRNCILGSNGNIDFRLSPHPPNLGLNGDAPISFPLYFFP